MGKSVILGVGSGNTEWGAMDLPLLVMYNSRPLCYLVWRRSGYSFGVLCPFCRCFTTPTGLFHQNVP